MYTRLWLKCRLELSATRKVVEFRNVHDGLASYSKYTLFFIVLEVDKDMSIFNSMITINIEEVFSRPRKNSSKGMNHINFFFFTIFLLIYARSAQEKKECTIFYSYSSQSAEQSRQEHQNRNFEKIISYFLVMYISGAKR